MKKIILFSLLVLTAVNTNAQSWLWAKNPAGSGISYGTDVATDQYGYTYSTGAFNGTVIFGTNTLTNTDSNYAVFVVKYNAAGNAVWARSAYGRGGADAGGSICTDAAGNVYVLGTFESPTITFGNTTLINNDTSGNTSDMFIVKYDSSGKVIWAKSGGSNQEDFTGSICSLSNNGIYLEGSYNGNSFTIDNITLNGNNKAYVIKLDTAGKIIWARVAHGSDQSDADGIGMDNADNLYVAGSFFGDSIGFNNVTVNVNNFGGGGIYLAKFDTSGNILWLKTALVGTASLGFDHLLGVDRNGYEYITGGFGDDPLENQFEVNVFVSKFDSLGNNLWSDTFPGAYYGSGAAAVIDNKGNIFVDGQFSSPTITFGSYTLTNASFDGVSTEIFVVELNPAGKVLWAMDAGGTGYNEANGIASDALGYIYVDGYFPGPSIAFGSITLSVSDSMGNFYIAKYASPTAGINEIVNHNGLFLYPNPANNVVHVTTNNMQGAQLTVCNMLGQVVYQSTITTAGTELNLSNLPPGMYLLKVQDGDEVHEGKLMLQ